MEKIINEKGIKSGDVVKIVLPEGIKAGDNIGGYTILEKMYNANKNVVKVIKADKRDVFVEIPDHGAFWFDNSCVQPLVEDRVPQFKVGDTVIITIPKEYNTRTHIPFGITESMLKLNGICTKIRRVEKAEYSKNDYPEISNLDGYKYYLENNAFWMWPNCLLTKVASYGFDYDLAKKILSPYQSMEQEAITSLTSLTSVCKVDGCTFLYDTCAIKEDAIECKDKKEDKDLIKIKSKKLKLNFKN